MSFEPFNWVCPYCGFPQSVVQGKFYCENYYFYLQGESYFGPSGLTAVAILCSNSKCAQVFVKVIHQKFRSKNNGGMEPYEKIRDYRLLPESSAKPQPNFIPEALRIDYLEACRIRDLSPKASATLARRCLQGMIRDFCKISKGRLVDEISALRDHADKGSLPAGVTTESIDAIDHVRGIGNIGAHMEKDINLIVPVDADEAQILIELIETLFDEWYVARHTRAERFARLQELADEKRQFIKDEKANRAALPSPD